MRVASSMPMPGTVYLIFVVAIAASYPARGSENSGHPPSGPPDPGHLQRCVPAHEGRAPAGLQWLVKQDAPSPDATKGLGFVPDYQALTPWNDAEIKRRS